MSNPIDFNDLFNENFYLLAEKDSDIIKTILSKKDEKDAEFDSVKKYYAFSIDKYQEFLKFISKLIKELKADENTIVLSTFLRKLIYDCYFSNSIYIDKQPDDSFSDNLRL